MLLQHDDHAFLREKALGEGLGDVATELRLVDVVDLVSYIRNEQFANVADLVSSAAERFFKPDTLRYGRSADVELHWGTAPTIRLDMEFHHRDVSVYFSLQLEEIRAGVQINYISFGNGGDSQGNTERLIDAIAAARLVPIATSAITHAASAPRRSP